MQSGTVDVCMSGTDVLRRRDVATRSPYLKHSQQGTCRADLCALPIPPSKGLADGLRYRTRSVPLMRWLQMPGRLPDGSS